MTCLPLSLLDFTLFEGRNHVLFLSMSPRLGTYTCMCSIKACLWTGSFCLNNPRDRGTHSLWYSSTSQVCMNFPQGLPLPHRYQSFHSTTQPQAESPIRGGTGPLLQLSAPPKHSNGDRPAVLLPSSFTFLIHTCQMGHFPLLPFFRGWIGVTCIIERWDIEVKMRYWLFFWWNSKQGISIKDLKKKKHKQQQYDTY